MNQVNKTENGPAIGLSVESWLGSAFPSESKKIIVEVFSQEGDPAFVCGCYGHITSDCLNEIEESLNDDRGFMEDGDGRYLYSARYVEAQRNEYGRIELPAYWDLTLIAFKPNDGTQTCRTPDSAKPSL